jgi:hypothetical protein
MVAGELEKLPCAQLNLALRSADPFGQLVAVRLVKRFCVQDFPIILSDGAGNEHGRKPPH